MPGVDFLRVRELVRIADVLQLAGFEVTEQLGEQLRGPCPVHRSTSQTSRSLSVNLRKHTFHCFKCGASGNQLDLWVAVTRLPLPDAARDLCQRLGIDVPEIQRW